MCKETIVFRRSHGCGTTSLIEEKLANHDLAAEKYLADSNPFKSGPDEDSSFFFTDVLTLGPAIAHSVGVLAAHFGGYVDRGGYGDLRLLL
ncbi:hypothetical protein DY000_02047522 [Brassica cretica]|uniref:Uncharacterized protein n=1 Tax=Brassica cretica TaxID=69181 RepID=A0ABQ7ESH3_BRACR|nr:hypothetical protein DY000_02047522 [Brassica cretica]